jgi:transposase
MALEKVKLVMDRGFYSESNINSLYQNHLKFLMGAKVSLKYVQVVLDEVRDTMRSRSSYRSSHKLNYHSRTIDWNYQEQKKRSGTIIKAERRMYLHLFYNDQKSVDDKAAFNALLDSLEAELLSSSRVPEHEKLYEKYFTITRTPVRGTSIEPKQEAIVLAERNYGFFCLISNDIKDPFEALDIYRAKDVIEKAFGNLKERLNMRRTSVSSEQNLEGKLFVQFVALMHLAYIDKKMVDNLLYKDYTMHELLDELDVIESFEETGKRPRIGEITKKQIGLYQKLEVAVPT